MSVFSNFLKLFNLKELTEEAAKALLKNEIPDLREKLNDLEEHHIDDIIAPVMRFIPDDVSDEAKAVISAQVIAMMELAAVAALSYAWDRLEDINSKDTPEDVPEF